MQRANFKYIYASPKCAAHEYGNVPLAEECLLKRENGWNMTSINEL